MSLLLWYHRTRVDEEVRFFSFYFWFFLCVSIGCYGSVPEQKVRLVVFVHGTVGCGVHIVNPKCVLHDTLTQDCWSVQVLSHFRRHPLLFHEQPMQDLGFKIIAPSTIQACKDGYLPNEQAKMAVYHVAAAYDTLSNSFKECKSDRTFYATYGWTGFLSQTARKSAGFDMYDGLVSFCDWCKRTYNTLPEIDIITHSHGGNVALWLASAETVKQQGLQINCLFTLGNPWQQETQSWIASPVFSTIISAHSWGDGIQPLDIFSTTARRSYRRMADVIDLNILLEKRPSLRRCDILLMANHEPNRIDHANMWLMGKSKQVFKWLDPLPVVVFAPAYMQAVKQHSAERELLVCMHQDNSLVIKRPCAHNNYYTPLNSTIVFDQHTIKKMVNRVRTSWLPDDKSRRLLFNHKTYVALTSSVKEVSRERCLKNRKRSDSTSPSVHNKRHILPG